MLFSAFTNVYLYFNRMVYNIEDSILKPVNSRISIYGLYACVKRYKPATIWFTFI